MLKGYFLIMCFMENSFFQWHVPGGNHFIFNFLEYWVFATLNWQCIKHNTTSEKVPHIPQEPIFKLEILKFDI